MAPPSLLAIFDFDQTITDVDSDKYLIERLAPELYTTFLLPGYRERIPTSTLMENAFRKLHVDRNISASTIRKTVSGCTIPPPMIQLLQTLQNSKSTESAIVSDANTLYIEEVLRAHGINVEACFGRAGIFSNKAWIEEGKIRVKPLMNEGAHACESCPSNICKEPLTLEIIKTIKPKEVVFVGDGRNDFCAAKVLPRGSTVFPRASYTLDRILSKVRIDAKVVPWNSYEELQELIRAKIP